MHVRSFLYGLAASAVLSAAVAVAQVASLDDLVLASVNSEEITRRQLVARLLEYHGEDSLQKMVNRTLLLQAAKQFGLAATDEETGKKLEEIKAQFKKEDDFRGYLTRNGLTEKQYRDEVRYTILMEKVALKESPVTDEDLQQFDIRMLTSASEDRAKSWIKKLDDGADFRKLASEEAEDPAARRAGGRMKPFLRIEMLDVWRAIDSQKLKPGGYTKTPVLLTDASWAVIKLEGIQTVDKASPSEKERLVRAITRYRMDQWLMQARTRAKIDYPVPLATVLGVAAAR